MIDGVGKSGAGRIDASRGAGQGASVGRVAAGSATDRQGGVASAVFGLVAEGPPVDSAKVAQIRAAIAEGRYPVDAERIAERMVALDLPPRRA
ncbi:MAG TPA: flagellar biosynthesis anti-sigma factor FlgM [Allosphingosinicella sp.]|nr:flagellar biosynthesis anti-sigma factor FlgM [Allosphingosinicella sp.]